jgi:hypothetical protein
VLRFNFIRLPVLARTGGRRSGGTCLLRPGISDVREACDLPFLPRVWVNDLLGAAARTPPDRRRCRRIRRPLFPMAAAVSLDREQARLALSSGRHAGVRGHAAGARTIGRQPWQ